MTKSGTPFKTFRDKKEMKINAGNYGSRTSQKSQKSNQQQQIPKGTTSAANQPIK